MKNHLISCALLVALFSCGKKSGQNSGGSPNPANGSGPSLSREDALNQMSPDQRAALEKWQASPEKDCNADAILNGAITGEYVDLNLISSRLGNASLAKLTDVKWALLTPGDIPGGLQTSKRNSETQLNDQTTAKIDIQTQREGGICEVKIFGATIAKIQLARDISYFALGNADKSTEIEVSLDKSDASNSTGFMQYFFYVKNVLSDAFKAHLFDAKPEDLENLSKLVNINKEKLKNFRSSASLVTSSQANWAPFATSDRFLNIKGDFSAATSLLLEPATFQIVIPAQSWTLEGGKVLWTLPILYSAEKSSTVGNLKIKLKADKNNFLPVVREANNKDAISCLKSRQIVLRNEVDPFQVSFDDAAGGCGVLLKSSYEKAFLEDDKEFFPALFKNVYPQKNFKLNGWDAVFVSLLENIWESKGAEHIVENISTAAVSGADLPIAVKFQQHATLLQSLWKDSEELFRVKLEQQIREFARSWTLRFFQLSPNKEVLQRVFKAAEKTGVALPEIKDKLLYSQTSLPSEIPAGIENLESMSAELLKNLAEYRATLKQFDLESVGQKKVADIFNHPVTENDLAQWKTHLNNMIWFREKELSFASNNESGRKNKLHDFMEKGLVEGWSAPQTEGFFKMAELASLKLRCDYLTTPVEQINCAAGDKMSAAKGNLLDPAFEGRYAKLAPIFAEIYKKESTEFDLKNKLDNFWDPIWKNCSNEIFSERSSKLVSLVDAINGTEDFSRKYKLKNELSDLIKDCN